MIVVRIELWPGGKESAKKTIGEITIVNDLTGTGEKGNYRCVLGHAGRYRGMPGNWKEGRIVGHLRKLSPYHLLLTALKSTLEPTP